jgi:hypothetical protein
MKAPFGRMKRKSSIRLVSVNIVPRASFGSAVRRTEMRKAAKLGYIDEASGTKTTKRLNSIWEARMVFKGLGCRAGSTTEIIPRSRSTIFLGVPVQSITRSHSTILLGVHEVLTLHEAVSIMSTERLHLEFLYDCTDF